MAAAGGRTTEGLIAERETEECQCVSTRKPERKRRLCATRRCGPAERGAVLLEPLVLPS